MSFIEYTGTKRFVSLLFMTLIPLFSLGFSPIVRSSVAQAAGDPFSYEDYASVLNAYVDTNGMVNYKAHDEKNQCHIGDTVRIMETRPVSKDKRWRVVEIINKGEVAEVQPEEIA